MSAIDFNRVEQAFRAAMAARESGAAPDLAALCEGDEGLAQEVRSLLEHLDLAGQEERDAARAQTDRLSAAFLNPAELHDDRLAAVGSVSGAAQRGGAVAGAVRNGAAGVAAPMLEEWGASAAGQRVGDFTLLRPVGAGGMGVVFVAEQAHPRRTVALKLVRRGSATPHMLRRFEREAHLLGRLNHPGIAQVYAAGLAQLQVDVGPPVPVPYIAMELIDGPNVLDYVRAESVERRADVALTLVADACDAIQHAHQRAVIHRDLKPANILVSKPADGQPQVKVLDFGVARLSEDDTHNGDGDAAGEAVTNLTGQHLVGTLAYMSPEQVRAGHDVDARSDVYALGVILYQLLCDRLPVDVNNRPLPDAARMIAEHEPSTLGTIDRAYRGDVETIVATALQKDVARRYQSPAELARDIRHYLSGEPIEARRDSLVYTLRKRAARYQTLTITSALLIVVLTAAVIYARKQQRASAQAAKVALNAQAQAAVAQVRAEHSADRLAEELSASRIDQGRLLGAAGDVTGAERLLWDEHFQHPENRSARWALWQLYSRSGCLRTIAAHPSDCRALSLAPDGKRFATGGDEPAVRIWSVPDAEALVALDTGLTSIQSLCFAPDGATLAAAGDGGALIVDLANGARRIVGPTDLTAHAIDFASNARAVAIGTDDGVVRVIEPSSGNVLRTIAAPSATTSGNRPAATTPAVSVQGVRFDPACAHLAASYSDGSVRLWNVTFSGGERLDISTGPLIAGRSGWAGYGVDFSPDGALLATGSADRTLTLWHVSDGSPVTTLATNNGSARSAAFSCDGQLVAVPGFWRTKLYDVATGRLAAPANLPALGDGGSFVAAFSGDEQLLIATGPAGTCRIWDLMADPTTVLRSTPAPVRDLAIVRLHDQCVIASIQSDGEIRLRRRPLDRDAGAPSSPAREIWRETLRASAGGNSVTVALTPDANLIVTGRADGHVVTLRASDGSVLQDLAAHRESVNVVRITPDGNTLVSGSSDDSLCIWRRRADGAGWEPGTAITCGGDVIGTAILPDGKSMVTSARPGQLQWWRLPDLRPIAQVTPPALPWRIACSPDGRRVAAGAWDRAVQVWDFDVAKDSSPHLAAILPGHTQLVLNVAFNDTADLLASVSNDGSLRIWDLTTVTPGAAAAEDEHRRCLAVLDAGAGDSLTAAFLPREVVGTADAAPSADQARGAKAAGGSSIAVGYLDGSVRIWDLNYFDRHINGQIAYQRALRAKQPTAGAAAATDGSAPPASSR